MQIALSESRHTFAMWLRTGRFSAGGIERKFNPYHDPRDGRFTFGPGVGSVSRAAASTPWHATPASERSSASPTAFSSFLRGRPLLNSTNVSDLPAGLLNDGVFHQAGGGSLVQQVEYEPEPPEGVGSNSRSFQDPMTLEPAFPGLRDTPGGLILPLADNVFNFTGPMNDLTSSMSLEYSRKLIDQIKTVDPSYVFQSFGEPTTLEGQMREIGDLRLDRAATLYRVREETAPLQVETLRFVQHSTDRAYDAGVRSTREESSTCTSPARKRSATSSIARCAKTFAISMEASVSRPRATSRSGSTAASMIRPEPTAPSARPMRA